MAAFGAATASPAFAIEGVSLQITQMSDRFEAGEQAGMTVVASKSSGGCLRVRWSMVMRVEGMRLDQVEVVRVEADRAFPLEVRNEGSERAQFTDAQLDPGNLCRNRTVTAQYALRFDDDIADGRVALEVGAFDARRRLLETTSATRNIGGGGSTPSPSPSASRSPSAAPSESESAAPAGDEAAEAGEETEEPVAGTGAGDSINATPASGSSGMLPVGLAVGGMMVFFGLAVLVRARRRLRAQPAESADYGRVWYGVAATRRQRRR
ncbi:hypothetical protein WEI85_46720 [Actinomycetes bacterium KLBMP 9797]